MAKPNKSLNDIYHHIETYNREMGEVQTDIRWIKQQITKVAKKEDIEWIKWAIGIDTLMIISIIGLILGVI